jgi:hypothetical protein
LTVALLWKQAALSLDLQHALVGLQPRPSRSKLLVRPAVALLHAPPIPLRVSFIFARKSSRNRASLCSRLNALAPVRALLDSQFGEISTCPSLATLPTRRRAVADATAARFRCRKAGTCAVFWSVPLACAPAAKVPARRGGSGSLSYLLVSTSPYKHQHPPPWDHLQPYSILGIRSGFVLGSCAPPRCFLDS